MLRTRFAPSPTGPLHLGHAYSAMLNSDMAKAAGGEFLLRIEDTDKGRCKPAYEAAIFEDLEWLGLVWKQPVWHQSNRLDDYDRALQTLIDAGLCYPCGCSRKDVRDALSAPQEGQPQTGPDGIIYPGTCRHRLIADRKATDAIRLNVQKVMQLLPDMTGCTFTDDGPVHAGTHLVTADRLQNKIGDIVLARRDINTASYHLAVVVDDAAQDISHVIRGCDLFEATYIHRTLQALLGLPTPRYHHHTLIRDDNGKRLAKRTNAQAIARYREHGASPDEIRTMVGLG